MFVADPMDPAVGRSGMNLTDSEIYTFAFYYIATTTVGCGFGDFMPANSSERACTAVLFFICESTFPTKINFIIIPFTYHILKVSTPEQ